MSLGLIICRHRRSWDPVNFISAAREGSSGSGCRMSVSGTWDTRGERGGTRAEWEMTRRAYLRWRADGCPQLEKWSLIGAVTFLPETDFKAHHASINQSRFDYQENSCQRPPLHNFSRNKMHVHVVIIGVQWNNLCFKYDRLWLWFRITAQDIGECLYFLWVFV